MRRWSRWRVAVLAALYSLPVAGLAGYGVYELWITRWWLYVWMVVIACWATATFLTLYWQRNQKLIPPIDFKALVHWTDRDREAWKIIDARAKESGKVSPDQLVAPAFYTETAQSLAYEVARVYHPGTGDPVGPLTIPELLAVVELASHDLSEMVSTYLPGGHLLTVNDWKRAKQASDWYQNANKAYWLVAGLFSPVETGFRYLASHLGMTRPLQQLQQNLLVWFYTAYLQRLGTYLIELNSGRLRVGATRYRQIMAEALATQTAPAGVVPNVPGSPAAKSADGPTAVPAAPADGTAKPDPADHVRRVTITLMGQVKAGKSSLINGFLGEQRAKTAVLPTTAEVTRYELQPPEIPTRLVLLDTVGYHHTSARRDQVALTADAAQQSDVLLLVTHAANPARQADLEFLTALKAWFKDRPELKMPPVLGVVTHIDLLSPSLEWAPPYDWQHPKRPKEHSIQGAVEAATEQLGPFFVGTLPVCVAPGKVYGVDEFLLPALSTLLEEARAVALLRVLRNEADTAKVRRVFSQFYAAGREGLKILVQNLPKA